MCMSSCFSSYSASITVQWLMHSQTQLGSVYLSQGILDRPEWLRQAWLASGHSRYVQWSLVVIWVGIPVDRLEWLFMISPHGMSSWSMDSHLVISMIGVGFELCKVWGQRRRTHGTGQSERMIFNTIPTTPDDRKRLRRRRKRCRIRAGNENCMEYLYDY